ncbi:MAG: hypothetical protein GWP14_05925 [Actinobacteria bacterium]|nr:hypothetical protein [Actinomycetota bacterium]
MSQTYRLKRFTNVAILKQIHFPLLLEFFESDQRFRDFLVQRGLSLTADTEQFDYDELAKILMSPDVNTPDELLDALYFVDNLAEPDHYDRMLEECRARNIDLGPEDPSVEDLTLRLWLADPKILERIHAEQYRVRPKKFESYFTASENPPAFGQPSEATLSVLEGDLNRWFHTRKKGRGTRVFPFVKEDGVWFLIRHGQHIKRQGTMEQDGESGSVFFRPEKFDVLIYYPEKGELAIYANTKGERKTYCRYLGKHFFADSGFFCFDHPFPKYTLQTLIELGRKALICSDIEGIEQIRLYELHFSHNSDLRNWRMIRGDDVFAEMEANGPNLLDEDESIILLKAKFKVTFAGGKERTVVIEPPNIAAFDRESDNAIIHEWLDKRGFICIQDNQEPTHVEEADAVLAVS